MRKLMNQQKLKQVHYSTTNVGWGMNKPGIMYGDEWMK